MAFFAARQPILDANKSLFGYELLFRNSMENAFPNVDEEKATSKMIEGLYLNLGLDRIADDKLAFINFTKSSIMEGHPSLLPANKVVIEVLESVQPSDKVYSRLKSLHAKGFILALDDFIHNPDWERFYPLCQVIKIDCLNIDERQLADIVAVAARHPHLKLLAEKVENTEVFEQYKALGFSLFQGYFFSKPEVIKSVSLNSSQTLLSSLLSEISKLEPNLNEVVNMFELDPGLSFKLLRYAQSPFFQRRKKIESIRQAVIMLGKSELERFVSLLFAATFGEAKPDELIRLSLQRAKFCEVFAERTTFKSKLSSAFLVGMLSLLDAMLDANLATVISQLPLSSDIKVALVRHQGWLADCIKLCKQFEQADWQGMLEGCAMYDVDYESMLEAYNEAIAWSEKRLAMLQ
ncbi:EAL and HDOD domain-containing protein [Glaciecola siphonariae]|uniref:EAL and HDOD domain-containing protein n=1 Tax=Glaciecola siphonariae TaxID=521012 RepID=A0ABV9LRL3_9ALTE